MVAPVHLEREPAEVAQPLLAEEEERAALAAELACGGRRGLAAEEGHGVEDTPVGHAPRGVPAKRLRGGRASDRARGYSWRTTRRSSVSSRTAQAGPSRVLPESLTPP